MDWISFIRWSMAALLWAESSILVEGSSSNRRARVASPSTGGSRDRPANRSVVETSTYAADAPQRQGVGRLLYEALVDTLRAQGFTQAIGVIALPNDASITLHEAVGFRRAGVYREVGYKQGRWIDVGLWQCALNESAIPPIEPRAFRDVGVRRD